MLKVTGGNIQVSTRSGQQSILVKLVMNFILLCIMTAWKIPRNPLLKAILTSLLANQIYTVDCVIVSMIRVISIIVFSMIAELSVHMPIMLSSVILGNLALSAVERLGYHFITLQLILNVIHLLIGLFKHI